MPYPAEDLTGRRFGRLIVTKRASNAGRCIRWHCVCTCDRGRATISHAADLRRGKSTSCGCLGAETQAVHGHASLGRKSPEYISWQHMIARCYNKNDVSYAHYGGRGIEVCAHWRSSFEAFLKYIGRRPSAQHSLDRHPDNDGNYKPGNVRWATPTEQTRNKRTNRFFPFRGKTLCLADWAKAFGIHRATLGRRLQRASASNETFGTVFTSLSAAAKRKSSPPHCGRQEIA